VTLYITFPNYTLLRWNGQAVKEALISLFFPYFSFLFSLGQAAKESFDEAVVRAAVRIFFLVYYYFDFDQAVVSAAPKP
jgi:hypothetical protein